MSAGFGQCITCGNPVERVGWDDECFGCQQAWDEDSDASESERDDALPAVSVSQDDSE